MADLSWSVRGRTLDAVKVVSVYAVVFLIIIDIS